MKRLAKGKGLSINALERELGFSRGSLNKMDVHAPSIDRLKKIADYLEVPLHALDPSLATNQPSTDHSHWIPVLGRVAAGIPIEMIEDIEDYEEIDDSMGECFGLVIDGDSMSPDLPKGSTVIVHKQDDIESGQIAIVCINGDDATCKKLIKHESGITLASLNPSYEPKFFTNEEIETVPIRILGRVIESRRKW